MLIEFKIYCLKELMQLRKLLIEKQFDFKVYYII